MTKEKVCIAIDVGGTNLRFCLVDQAGKLLFRERQSTEINRGRDDFLARLYSSIDYLKKKARLKVGRLLASASGSQA